jgi:hypothetical protein
MSKLCTGGVILFFLITGGLVAANWSESGKNFSDFAGSAVDGLGESIHKQAGKAAGSAKIYLKEASGKASDAAVAAADKIKERLGETVEEKLVQPAHEAASHCIKSILVSYPILTDDDIKDIVSKEIGNSHVCD